ncbi:MAG: prepilin-type N-terminal cleavage/methylation domain-containing protein [Planctomycetota bacterium]|nr:MAG: prepilin-type N-terminal cleavage/methylation domain-containing protein [Planctomycetota bacterium]
MRRYGDAGGFTLIELLVAIAILALLSALALPAITAARRSGMRKACKAQIERLAAAAQSYEAAFGDYPPTALAALGFERTNGINEGIESLVRCVTTTRGGGPFYEPDEDELGNTDGDETQQDPTASVLGRPELLEVLDPWGRPLVYFHHRDYRGGRRIERYLFDETEQRLRPRPSPETGVYPAPVSFVIWSVGPDGVDQGGGGDDIASWR